MYMNVLIKMLEEDFVVSLLNMVIAKLPKKIILQNPSFSVLKTDLLHWNQCSHIDEFNMHMHTHTSLSLNSEGNKYILMARTVQIVLF